MGTLAEYNSIVAQLDGFLESDTLELAVGCITSADLKSKLREVTTVWGPDGQIGGGRQTFRAILEDSKEVVQAIRNGIFYRDGYIFYVLARYYDGASVRMSRSGNTFNYVVLNEQVVIVDIKNLCRSNMSSDLEVCENDGSLMTGIPNPFNLTNPRSKGDVDKGRKIHNFLPYGIRLAAFALDADYKLMNFYLRDTAGLSVLNFRFEYQGEETGGDVYDPFFAEGKVPSSGKRKLESLLDTLQNLI